MLSVLRRQPFSSAAGVDAGAYDPRSRCMSFMSVWGEISTLKRSQMKRRTGAWKWLVEMVRSAR
jgi:hypothetical protein